MSTTVTTLPHPQPTSVHTIVALLLQRLYAMTKPAPKAKPGSTPARVYIITDQRGSVVASR
jgi:hypothetical protein